MPIIIPFLPVTFINNLSSLLTMVKLFLMPQEIETFYILPSLRSNLAEILKEHGMKQKDIAEIMGINSATISQYRSQKRGQKIQFSSDFIDEMKVSAHKIKDRYTYIYESQRLLKVLRNTRMLCQIHRQFSDVPGVCDPAKVGCTARGI